MAQLSDIWRLPPQHLTLDASEIHVWCADLEQSQSSIAHFAKLLSADEQAKAARFRFERDRHHYTVGRGLLRTLLGRYLNLNPAKVQFVYGPHGKPELMDGLGGDRTLRFNLSHSHGLTLYAFTVHQQIGVDIEYIRATPDAEQIVNSYFSEQEKATFSRLSPDQQSIAFFNGWTRKEAYLKAIGDGLAHPLNQIEVTLTPDEPATLRSLTKQPQCSDRWLLQNINVNANYAAALVVEEPMGSIHYWQVGSTLINGAEW
ncbi:MAG TPA: 4'-phosphopantetheinyl transferase superfamily protein [Crinalium sp.]